jgi:hypothetical protein
MKQNTLAVSLVHELCNICARKMPASIVMNTKLTPGHAKRVEEMHGKAVGFSSEPCQECKDLQAEGFILIECDEQATTDRANPFRTGRIFAIKHEAAARMFKDFDMSKGAAFIDYKLIEALGINDLLKEQEGGLNE